MDTYDFVVVGLLLGAILVNSISVYAQKHHGLYHGFGRRAWSAHKIVLSIVWGTWLVSLIGLQYSEFRLDSSYNLLGIGLLLYAGFVLHSALSQIGVQALSNGNFFGRELRKLGGIYNYMNDPIYHSYVVALLGLGLLTGVATFLVCGVVAYFGFMFESAVERT